MGCKSAISFIFANLQIIVHYFMYFTYTYSGFNMVLLLNLITHRR